MGILRRLGPDGTPLFKEFAAAIKPTEFEAGKVFGSGTMDPIDYCHALAHWRRPRVLVMTDLATRPWDVGVHPDCFLAKPVRLEHLSDVVVQERTEPIVTGFCYHPGSGIKMIVVVEKPSDPGHHRMQG